MKTHHFKRRGIIRTFGTWAVTIHGVANTSGPASYDIDKEALAAVWWLDHMKGKRWVILSDFRAALDFAREHFGIKAEGGLLW